MLTQKRRARNAPANSRANQLGMSTLYILLSSLARRMADPFTYSIIPSALTNITLRKAVWVFAVKEIFIEQQQATIAINCYDQWGYKCSEYHAEWLPEGCVQEARHYHGHPTEDHHPEWVWLGICAVIKALRRLERIERLFPAKKWISIWL